MDKQKQLLYGEFLLGNPIRGKAFEPFPVWGQERLVGVRTKPNGQRITVWLTLPVTAHPQVAQDA